MNFLYIHLQPSIETTHVHYEEDYYGLDFQELIRSSAGGVVLTLRSARPIVDSPQLEDALIIVRALTGCYPG